MPQTTDVHSVTSHSPRKLRLQCDENLSGFVKSPCNPTITIWVGAPNIHGRYMEYQVCKNLTNTNAYIDTCGALCKYTYVR